MCVEAFAFLDQVVGFAGVVVVIRFEGVAFAGFVATFAFQKGTD